MKQIPRVGVLSVLCFTSSIWMAPCSYGDDFPVLLREDFSEGSDRWEPTDAKAWNTATVEKEPIYRLERQSEYRPPHRSPVNISLLKEVEVSDFVLDVDLRSTTPDYPHRSLCLFFGWQDPAHYYYVHFGKRTDDHANQIFIVNDAPRVKISAKTTPGTPWDDKWHHVKIVRTVDSGKIAVFFDDMENPVMTAEDSTFVNGRIGLGSFDDIGDFDNVVLRGRRVETAAEE